VASSPDLKVGGLRDKERRSRTAENIAFSLPLMGRRRLKPAAIPGSRTPREPHMATRDVAPSGVTKRSTHTVLRLHSGKSHEIRVLGAGGIGIEPAPCGFGGRGALSSGV